MSIRSKNVVTLLAVGLIVLLGAAILVAFRPNSKNATLNIEAVPADVTISLNGATGHQGENRVKAGDYDVTAHRQGFADGSRHVHLSKNQAQYVGIALIPNDPKYTSWYKDHPQDAKIAEGIASKTFDATGIKQLINAPFLRLLPFVQPSYRIDYGASQKTPTDPSKFAIYITYTLENDKQAALKWLAGQGANAADLEIVYKQLPPILVR